MTTPLPRIAAVDFGTKRVGLAVTDPLRLFAQPFGTFSQDEAVSQLRALAEAGDLALIVVGWPLLEDGTEGAMVERVRAYAGRLRNALPGVQVVAQDERYTSERAKTAIREAGARRAARRDRARVDAAAAALILQDYLDDH